MIDWAHVAGLTFFLPLIWLAVAFGLVRIAERIRDRRRFKDGGAS